MRYLKSWHAVPSGGSSYHHETGALSLGCRIQDGPKVTEGRNVDVAFTRPEVDNLIAALSMWYPDAITEAAAAIHECDKRADSGNGMDAFRYGRDNGYLRNQAIQDVLRALRDHGGVA